MPRPRFFALTPGRRQIIVDTALDEFAANGFAGASLNRIIAASGISKGSMYYYFDSKEDLYVYLLRDQVENMIVSAGPFPVPAASDPDDFWSMIEGYCLRLVEAIDDSPRFANLLRDWMSGAESPATLRAEREAEEAVQPWLTQTLGAGQAVGAVRTDIPDALILAVSVAIGRVIDSWVVVEASDPDDRTDAVRSVVGVLRRAIQP